MIHGGSQVTITSGPSLPPLVDSKEKRVHSLSPTKGMGKVKKSKGLPLPSVFASSSSKALIIEAVMEVKAFLDLGVSSSAGTSEALKVREEGLVAITETQVKIGEAQVSVIESSMQVTRSIMKTRTAIAKVKWA